MIKNNKKIKVLFLSSELTPLAKVGGLADVAGSLPKALHKLNLDVRVLMPYYEVIQKQKINCKKIAHVLVPFGKKHYIVFIYQTTLPNSTVPLYLIHHHEWLSSGPIYSTKRERFMFFTQAVNEFLKLNIFQPNIIHINDWHPAGLISLLKKDPENKHKHYKTLLTIHNLAMKGKVLNTKTKLWHPSMFKPLQEKHYFILKEGIHHCDLLNTVSPQYAKEILTKEYGLTLLTVLKKHAHKIHGILNGIDTELFNPKNDKYIIKKYSLKTIKNKKQNKDFLQKLCRFKTSADIPVFGLVTRITKQKGIDLIVKKIDELAKLNAQFVFTGLGKKPLENALKMATEKYPEKFYYLKKFDIPFGQYIYAGADIFLMPSAFEPCGLGQMIAMAYGTVPLVRATGGLKDSVKNKITGFVFNRYNADDFLKTVKTAIKAYQNKKEWGKMIHRAMRQDFTWHYSAREYLKLYQKLLWKK